MTQTAADLASPVLPAPPRDVTARVRRRAWADPRVRFWWLVAGGLLLAGIVLAITQYRLWQHENWLMSIPPVEAKITMTDKETVPNRPVKPGTPIELEFPSGTGTTKAWGVLSGYAGNARTGEPIAVHVNPEDPADLTVRNTELLLRRALTGAIIAAAVAVLPLSAAYLAWLGVLRVWRTGELRTARILGRQQTPLAPRSRLVRCTWEDDADRRIFDLYVPANAAEASPDAQTLQVVASPSGSGRLLAVAWFR